MKHSAMQYILGTSCWMCLRVMQGILGTSCWVKHCHAGHLRHVLNESPYHAWHHRDVTLSETPRHAGHLRHVMLSETTCVPCKNLWHIMFETQYHEERLRQVVLSETPSHADSDIFSTRRVGGKKKQWHMLAPCQLIHADDGVYETFACCYRLFLPSKAYIIIHYTLVIIKCILFR